MDSVKRELKSRMDKLEVILKDQKNLKDQMEKNLTDQMEKNLKTILGVLSQSNEAVH
jgi:hypothetical protein